MTVRENLANRIWGLLIIAGTVTFGGCLTDENAEVSTAAVPPPLANSAPSISGNPARAVRPGEYYTFTPTATDADGDELTFTIENQPRWSSFDPSTGSLTGIPTLGDVGTFSGIIISVSDGQARSSLNAYDVTVTEIALGSATLSWSLPTEYTDGAPLVDLAGFRIYYGTVSGAYSNSIQIDNTGVSTFIVENLIPDTYFFVATAFNSNGIESDYSNEAVKVVN